MGDLSSAVHVSEPMDLYGLPITQLVALAVLIILAWRRAK